MRLTLRAKIIALLIGCTVAALCAACAAFVVHDRTSYLHARRQTLGVLGGSLAGSVAGAIAFQDRDAAGFVLRTIAAEPMALSAEARAANGAPLARWDRPGAPGGRGAITIDSPVRSEGSVVGAVRLTFSTRDVDARAREFIAIALRVLVGATLAAALLALWMQRLVTGPVNALARAAARVRAQRDYSVRAQRVSDDELGTLTDAFNEMLAGIEARDAELDAHRRNLEDLVAQRTAALASRNEAMRLVLDNVDVGLVTFDARGAVSPEHSAAFARWFGAPPPDARFARHLSPHDARFIGTFEVGWEQYIEDLMPREVNLAQLPSSISLGDKHFSIAYRPLGPDDAPPAGALALVRDVTEERRARRAEAEQQEFVTAVERALANRAGFDDFVREGDALVNALDEVAGPALARALHTLKGNSAIYGLSSIAARCHAVEDRYVDTGAFDRGDVAALGDAWRALRARLGRVLGERGDRVDVPLSALHDAAVALQRAGDAEAAARLETWVLEPVSARFAGFAERARELAARLGRAPLAVNIEDHDVRVDHAAWTPLWASMVHVVRNAVDHGVETAEARVATGRSEVATLSLRAEVDGDAVVLEVADDGPGVNWAALREKARSRGLPHESMADLQAALFSDGVSTRDEATEVSGRGVGMGAYAEAVQALGGTLLVQSAPGRGTRVTARLPRPTAAQRLAA